MRSERGRAIKRCSPVRFAFLPSTRVLVFSHPQQRREQIPEQNIYRILSILPYPIHPSEIVRSQHRLYIRITCTHRVFRKYPSTIAPRLRRRRVFISLSVVCRMQWLGWRNKVQKKCSIEKLRFLEFLHLFISLVFSAVCRRRRSSERRKIRYWEWYKWKWLVFLFVVKGACYCWVNILCDINMYRLWRDLCYSA